jgi:hypothetical protein
MARVNIDQAKKVLTAHRLAAPHHKRTVDLIANGARRLVPRGNHLSGSGKRRRGQTLAQSLQVRSRTSTNRLSDLIGSTKQYAASEHQGSQPHYINSRGKMLKFEWERGNIAVRARGRRGRVRGRAGSPGNFFFFIRVRHPGNKRPVRYLTTPMHMYGRMRGFSTSSQPVNRSRLP